MPGTVLAASHPIIAPLTEEQLSWIREAAGDIEVWAGHDLEAQLRLVTAADILLGDGQPAVLDAGTELRCIQSVAAVDRIARHLGQRDVKLVSAKGGIVGSHLAEHAFALLLSITRQVVTVIREPAWTDEYRIAVRARQWELTDRTMLIIGLGGAG